MKKLNIISLIVFLFLLVFGFIWIYILFISETDDNENINKMKKENNLIIVNSISLNNELEYNEKGNVVAKKVVRIADLNGNDISTITEDSVLVINKNEYPFIDTETIKNILKKDIVVLLKYENLEEDVQFYLDIGIEGHKYNTEEAYMEKYKNDGYINLELGETGQILLDSYLFKAETDENLLKYINMSIKMLSK